MTCKIADFTRVGQLLGSGILGWGAIVKSRRRTFEIYENSGNGRMLRQDERWRKNRWTSTAWLKESRRIATRYDKTVESFLAFVQCATVRMVMKRI